MTRRQLPDKNIYLVRSATELPDELSYFVIYNCLYDAGHGPGLYYTDDESTLTPLGVNPTYATPTSVTLNDGTSTDSVTDIQTLLDGNIYTINEVAATPGFDLRINFTNVFSVSGVVLRSYYAGAAIHHVEVALYNYDTTTFDLFIYESLADSYNYRTILIPQGIHNYHDSSGNAVIRIYHPDNGVASHDYFVDYAAIIR